MLQGKGWKKSDGAPKEEEIFHVKNRIPGIFFIEPIRSGIGGETFRPCGPASGNWQAMLSALSLRRFHAESFLLPFLDLVKPWFLLTVRAYFISSSTVDFDLSPILLEMKYGFFLDILLESLEPLD